MPVVRTPKTKRPSKRPSRASTARQRSCSPIATGSPLTSAKLRRRRFEFHPILALELGQGAARSALAGRGPLGDEAVGFEVTGDGLRRDPVAGRRPVGVVREALGEGVGGDEVLAQGVDREGGRGSLPFEELEGL